MTIGPQERSGGETNRQGSAPVQSPGRRTGGPTLRRRILWIAWGPSLALLIIGGTIAGYLAVQQSHIKSVADVLSGGSISGPFLPAVDAELAASAQAITDPSPAHTQELAQTRIRTNTALKAFLLDGATLNLKYENARYRGTDHGYNKLYSALPVMRQGVDKGTLGLIPMAKYYAALDRSIGLNAETLAATAPDGESANAVALGGSIMALTGAVGEANGLSYAAFSDNGMTDAEYAEFAQRVGEYQQILNNLKGDLGPAATTRINALLNSAAWRQQQSVEQAVMASKLPAPKADATTDGTTSTDGTTTDGTATNGSTTDATSTNGTSTTGNTSGATAGTTDTSSANSAVTVGRTAKLPISRDDWTASSDQVFKAFGDMSISQTIYGGQLASALARTRIIQAALIGGFLLVFAGIVLLLTTRESNRIVNRLRRLQAESLDLASNRLPRMVQRLREGDKVEESEELTPMELGQDEIGQVADAFNYSQRVAVRAAIREAETRAGLRAVFLNIAYRSQVIVHRQLNVLERAERFQEDPEQLKLLFELDHLSTRARRNAENLVILGGGQPGRQWRNSVALLQVVRGAISEAEDYARVSIGQLPQLSVGGATVGDVIHLLAEVVDNATSFSPPMSRVEVRGNMVGRGLVLEIEDQGLGIPPDQLDQLNQMMQDPPDFHVMALREEPRLGMFVVAQLAQSHGIRVTLTPSPAYGGTRVVILLPNELLDTSGRTAAALAPEEMMEMEPEEEFRPMAMPAAPVQSVHDRMAFEGDVLAGNTGEFSMPRWDQPRMQEEPVQPPSRPPLRRAPMLSVAPSGPSGPYETAPRPVVSATPSSRPGRPERPERPELPRRSRQSHLSDRLRTSSVDREPTGQMEAGVADPDIARNRMAAFQRGTQRGRIETPDSPA
jgi:signal transduction histidine kinase